MFKPEFYPTPDTVISRMTAPYLKDIKKLSILEPSAGSGAILDYLTKYLSVKPKQVYAIEQDDELTYSLQGKGHRVIHRDFLSYSGDYWFDLILMNPPFSNGDEHLLKAWEVLQGGHITCLLNEQTIKNPHTRQRKLVCELIEQYGSVEYIGNAFRNAPRMTNVGVAMVRLEKPVSENRFSFSFERNESQYQFSEETAGNAVAMQDLTGAMLRQYELTKSAYVDYLKARKALEFYSGGLLFIKDIDELASGAYKNAAGHSQTAYNEFVADFNKQAWANIIQKLNFGKFLTSGVLDNFNRFKETQGAMDLTRENIANLIQLLLLNRDKIMTDAVVDVFDIFTKYHQENRCHVEGWKTNSAWKVNRKVILPNFLQYVDKWTSYYHVNYDRSTQFRDIDKVMCFLTGKNWDDFYVQIGHTTYAERDRQYKMMSLENAISRVKVGDNSLHESEFFQFRCFKKGTVHITFKDEALWARFNQTACKGKNWLPK